MSRISLRHGAVVMMMAVAAVLLLAVSAQTDSSGLVLRVEGPIGPATSDFIVRGIERAADENAALVLIEMGTPGGLDSAMRDIIKAILASPVAVVTYVSPSGSRAASAGTYIMYASHIAAMAPATNLGAATPVPIGGSSPSAKDPADSGQQGGDQSDGEVDDERDEATGPASRASRPDDASTAKAVNDAVAYIRSLAERRGRNADWAESAVRDAASLSADQALKQGVIDIVASDRADLLRQIDGRVVETSLGEITLATAGLTLERVERGWRTKLLEVITNPTVAYLLMLVGIYGLLFEGYNPGAVVPGVTGAICLLLAAYAFQILPVNFAGLALMVLGIGLMTAEAFVPSFGVLGIGGIAAFVTGSVILMDTDVPGFVIATSLIASVALAGGLVVMGIIWLAAKSFRRPVVSGSEQLRGLVAEVTSGFPGAGHVLVHGELWSARCPRELQVGQPVKVTRVDGLTLTVEPVESSEPQDQEE